MQCPPRSSGQDLSNRLHKPLKNTMKYGGLVLARLRAVSHFLQGPSLESEIISEKKLERGAHNSYFLSECLTLRAH